MTRPALVAKFICPTCGYATVSRVADTRGALRRRICQECGDSYPTEERVIARRRRPHHRPRARWPGLPFGES